MSFTQIAIQGLFPGASGLITARLSDQLVNLPDVSPAVPIAGLLDGKGRIVAQSYAAFILDANDDDETEPPATNYTFTIQLNGSSLQEFQGVVSNGATATDTSATTIINSATVLLGDLIAASTMVGTTITCADFPGGTTVLAYDDEANTILLSNVSSATSPGIALTVGGCAAITSLAA